MASTDAAAQMWARTSFTPRDVDVAELYDGFTFLTFAWLEALGLCGDGEAGPFVEGGKRIALDGDLPLNTYGGQLSAGRMHGYWVVHEAVLQLRAGTRRRGRRRVRRRRPHRRLHAPDIVMPGQRRKPRSERVRGQSSSPPLISGA